MLHKHKAWNWLLLKIGCYELDCQSLSAQKTSDTAAIALRSLIIFTHFRYRQMYMLITFTFPACKCQTIAMPSRGDVFPGNCLLLVLLHVILPHILCEDALNNYNMTMRCFLVCGLNQAMSYCSKSGNEQPCTCSKRSRRGRKIHDNLIAVLLRLKLPCRASCTIAINQGLDVPLLQTICCQYAGYIFFNIIDFFL